MKNSEPEELEDQLDRLNHALQHVLTDIKSHHGRETSSRLSIVPSEYWDESSLSEKSDSLVLDDGIATKVAELLQDRDRLQMLLEDCRSQDLSRHNNKLFYTQGQISNLVSQLETLNKGENLNISLGDFKFHLTHIGDTVVGEVINKQNDAEYIARLEKEIEELRKTDTSSLMGSSIEGEEICGTCGIDAYRLRKEIRIELEIEYKKRKNEALEKEKANFESQLEELDKLKDSYLKKFKDLNTSSKILERKKNDLEKREMDLARKKSEFEKKKHDREHKVMSSKEAFEPPSEAVFSPSKFSQEELENQLSQLRMGDQNDSKTVMKISQIESQLARIRTERAISECNKKNSRLLFNLVSTIDKETSQDENKRKQMLDRTTKKYEMSENIRKKQENANSIKKNEVLAKQILDKKYELLLQKERDLQEKEKFLQNTWKKVPGAKELVAVIQTSLDHLNQSKNYNESVLNRIDQEKMNIGKAYEKLISAIDKLESHTKSTESFEKIKDQLNASLNFLIIE